MARISVVVCSRVSGNRNYGLFNLLDSVEKMSADPGNVEVLVKFDSDDRRVKGILPRLKKYPFPVKYLIEPRGRGYLDLHVFYTRLFTLVDDDSRIVVAMGDDFTVIRENWDTIILEKADKFPDQIFIMHGRPHPSVDREDYETRKFNMDFDLDSMEDLHIIDEAPIWSRKLIELCGGFGMSSTTDCWTVTLEYFLYHRCGLNRTIFLDDRIAHRWTQDDVDQNKAVRWWKDRVTIFEYLKSRAYKKVVEQQAVNIYCYIKMFENGALPAPFQQPESDYTPRRLTAREMNRLKLREFIRRPVPRPLLRLFDAAVFHIEHRSWNRLWNKTR